MITPYFKKFTKNTIFFLLITTFFACGGEDSSPSSSETQEEIIKQGSRVNVKIGKIPEDILSSADVAKIDTLLSAALEEGYALQSVSPDGLYLTYVQRGLNHIYNIQTQESAAFEFPPTFTDIRWVADHTLQVLYKNDNNETLMSRLDAQSMQTTPEQRVALDDRVVCLASDMSRAITQSEDENQSRFYSVNLQDASSRLIVALEHNATLHRAFDFDKACMNLVLGVKLNLMGEAEFQNTNYSYLSSLTPAAQDALGNYPLDENPFLNSSYFEIYTIKEDAIEHHRFDAKELSKKGYIDAIKISYDGTKVAVYIVEPLNIKGRENPVFFFSKLGYTAVFDASLQPITTINFQNGSAASEERRMVFDHSGSLWSIVTKEFDQNLYRYDFTTSKIEQMTDMQGSIAVSLAVSQEHILFEHSSIASRKKFYALNTLTGESRVVFDPYEHNTSIHNADSLRADVLEMRLKNGVVRKGLLIQKADAPFPPKNTPLVLWQAGGPGSDMLNRWSSVVEIPFNLLPNFDIALLVLPLHMRPGWSAENFTSLVEGDNFGSADIDEAKAFLEAMAEEGLADSTRFGITGCSYGGYFTSMSLRRTGDFYAAANTQCSWLNLFGDYAHWSTPTISYVTGTTPYEDPYLYLRLSPLYRSEIVKTPTLMFHGSEDFFPIGDAIDFYAQIEQGGTPVRLLGFEGVGHGIGDNIEYEKYAAQEMIAWFRNYLRLD